MTTNILVPDGAMHSDTQPDRCHSGDSGGGEDGDDDDASSDLAADVDDDDLGVVERPIIAIIASPGFGAAAAAGGGVGFGVGSAHPQARRCVWMMAGSEWRSDGADIPLGLEPTPPATGLKGKQEIRPGEVT